ncbi:(3R)-3-[(carboxymethyl)amino]fatty acid oxygenase/decarboxylase [Streptomyces sp. DT24]|uniref:(3R)-3-[(carboxymethyl)amino]fatty acid oxygenase/decarboxylase n=1 Tax=unclassified Streptomyces TaxID=2593676 RepID=UPI0023B9D16B|nr:TauD/TfdA family dioxygenase [Streptomyces sp. AM 4-1-1]WEH36336.1 TauD/TfdA family dioxygenase [Streptomyces sp. AM 4-1-1]
MEINRRSGEKFGSTVEGFDLQTATAADFEEIKSRVYSDKILVLKDQDLSPEQFLRLGRSLGTPETYYEPMYQHPEVQEIFVSSNVKDGEQQVGVPKTGKFWHADYMFMPKPFGLTLIYPQVVPTKNRGTFFIDMGRAYETLPQDLKDSLEGAVAVQSVRRYFKIRPHDVYRPISEILQEIETKTPASPHPAVFKHPATGEQVLYVSEGFTESLRDADGDPLDESVLRDVLEAVGQLDETCEHENIHLQTFEKGDLLVWDNRSLVHRALHTATPEPTVSYRVTVHDSFPFYEGIDA